MNFLNFCICFLFSILFTSLECKSIKSDFSGSCLQTVSEPCHISVSAVLSDSTGKVTITMTGQNASTYYAIGWGGTIMNKTYAIIALGTGAVQERQLGDHNPGTLLNPTVTVLSNTVSNGVRTVVLERALVGFNASYYTFSTSILSIPIIYAFHPTSATLTYHGALNKNRTNLTFYELPDYDTLLATNINNWNKYLNSDCNCNHYQYVFTIYCFCTPCYIAPKIVEVENNQVISVRFENQTYGNEECSDFELQSPYDYYYSILGLFKHINQTISNQPDALTINYDATCGYPTLISVDQSFFIADEEYVWTISNLRCLNGNGNHHGSSSSSSGSSSHHKQHTWRASHKKRHSSSSSSSGSSSSSD